MDYSYLGSGQTYIRKYGAAAPFLPVGNASGVNINVTEQNITLQDYTKPGGGTYNEVKRIESVDLSLSLHDISPENLARALLGTVTNAVAGTAVAEDVVAYKGGFVPLAHVPKAITTVAPAAGGGSDYEEGDDYELRDGGLWIPAGSSITAPVDGAPNIKVTYTYDAQDTVQALTESAQDYEVVFVGLNEARGGKAVRVQLYRVKFGPTQVQALISADEHAVLEVSGRVQSDSTKSGAGVSSYFKETIVA